MNMFITKPFMMIIYLSDVYRYAYYKDHVVAKKVIGDIKNAVDMCGEGKLANELKVAFGDISEQELQSIEPLNLDDVLYDKIARLAVCYDTKIAYAHFRRGGDLDMIAHYKEHESTIKTIYQLYLDQQQLYKNLITI